MDCGNPTTNITAKNLEYNSGTSPVPTTFSATSILKCRTGYRFADFSVGTKTITCQANAAWADVISCTSILLDLKLIYQIRLIFNF